MHHANGSDCQCGGLSGLGFTDTTLVEQPAQQQTWWQTAIQEVTKLIPRTPTSYPIYTPPQYPSEYPSGYPSDGYAEPQTNWTPFVIGGLVLLMLMRRGR